MLIDPFEYGTDTEAQIWVPNIVSLTGTFVGDAQIDTAQKKVGSSSLWTGDGDYIYFDDSDDWTLGTDDFTIDSWIRRDTDAYAWVLSHGVVDNWYTFYFDFGQDKLFFYSKTSGVDDVLYSANWSPNQDTWYHIAVVREGITNWYLFIGGASQEVTLVSGSASASIPNRTGTLKIGKHPSEELYNDGWIDELRFSNTARWTANFTPQTTPYDIDDNTKLLLHFEGNDGDTTTSSGGITATSESSIVSGGKYSLKVASDAGSFSVTRTL